MSGSLTHSPADIIRNLLVNLGLGTTPSAAGSWPVYAEREPDAPDSVITVYNTAGRKDGRVQVGGEVQEHHGFQVRIRAANPVTGYTKAQAIAIALDETVYQDTVTISAATYLVHAVSRVGSVLALGKETPTSKRNLFTINAVAALRQTV